MLLGWLVQGRKILSMFTIGVRYGNGKMES